jgi:hypothetical protein
VLDHACEVLNEVPDGPIFLHEPRDLRRRVDDRRMVAPAELPADLRQRGVRELARQVHRDLTRVDDVLRALVAAELGQAEPEAVGDELLNGVDRDLGRLTVW